ncbi:hypothetical protein [Leptothoe spongobia]|uniref:Uncharacterized protein n=1 Tax=Leptothoe spongobia TAU-MAC 1115 TaxID=1967444 RepID=A0A947GL65_9CYAN|nr:hypothetical protein [Leptothoe spongobia]MBT9317248.1 hypothetical protein [Leptothoe spongobia TAU-MAC 1115]
MKRFNTSTRVLSGILTTALMLTIPVRARAANHNSHLETNSSNVQTVIEEWHWRDMNF